MKTIEKSYRIKSMTMKKNEKIQRILSVVHSCENIQQKTNAVNWGLTVMDQMGMNSEEIFNIRKMFFSTTSKNSFRR